ncbi:MAG: methionyl-tRNA formyltransferase [Siculibacillus sp.]|nr:methionyl-tRNA formyltransferase [Siculibacillus sp.]
MPLRVVFMGTPDFSVPTLRAVHAAGHEIVAAYSQPPRPAGRGLALTLSPVQAAAETLGIPVFHPTSLKGEEAAAAFRAHAADVAVVVAYGLLLPETILDAPRYGCLNLHGSKLPRWRGAAPIQRAIMAGDAETAVEVMRMEKGLDTGPVCLSATTAIGPEETTGDLHDRLASLGAATLVEALGLLEAGELGCLAQPEEGVTYARKIDKAEAHIDWRADANTVHDTIRGLSPTPGAWCEARIGGKLERLKILRTSLGEGAGEPGTILDDAPTVACGTGAVRLVQVQRAGGKPVEAAAFRRGAGLAPGDRLA